MMADISILDESKTFHNVLKKTAEKYGCEPNLGLDGVIQNILKPSKEKWEDLGQKLKAGSISFYDIEKYCFHELHDDDMIREFIVMNRRKTEKWIGERIIQLQRFKRSLNTVTVAKPLLEVKERCNIIGSFTNLELIANLVCSMTFLFRYFYECNNMFVKQCKDIFLHLRVQRRTFHFHVLEKTLKC